MKILKSKDFLHHSFLAEFIMEKKIEKEDILFITAASGLHILYYYSNS
jgi:hypothetical protein